MSKDATERKRNEYVQLANDLLEKYETNREKFIYFLLAAAGASIGYILSPNMQNVSNFIYIGNYIVILLFSLSFYAGCKAINLRAEKIDRNGNFFLVFRNSVIVENENTYIVDKDGNMYLKDDVQTKTNEEIRPLLRKLRRYEELQYKSLISAAVLFATIKISERYNLHNYLLKLIKDFSLNLSA